MTSAAAAHPSPDAGDPTDDPYRWLEEVTGDEALAWVRDRNTETVAELTTDPLFTAVKDEIRAVLDADDRIPYVVRRAGWLWNFWRDAAHPRGLWRRTTLESYRTAAPDWRTVLDIDALAAAEDENWVWGGATFLLPDYRRCLVELSRGGADATVVREFDPERSEFVTDGFTVPEAKSSVGWIDADHLYIGTDFGPGTMTDSGYPRVVRRWRRGTPLAEAVTVFEGEAGDVAVSAGYDPVSGRHIVDRMLDFYRSRRYLLVTDDTAAPAGPTGIRPADEPWPDPRVSADRRALLVDVPEDASVSMHHDWMLVELRSPWTVGGREHPAGALLATRVSEYLAGDRSVTVLFEPDEHTALSSCTWTRGTLLVAVLADVQDRLRRWIPEPDGWRSEALAEVPELASVDVVSTDPVRDDEYLLNVNGYLTPSTLYRCTGDDSTLEPLKSAPTSFDPTGLTVSQHFATSADGTAVPYFRIGPDDGVPRPTLLYGYGGFEVSLRPGYSGTVGRAWLARGGVYVVANIRGGGEYGPRWHQAALTSDRHRAYEDFAAVAADLTARGVTTADRLGTVGGSNGGLLTGNMLVSHPELFGAVVIQVPLLDMKRYSHLLAGASWMAEYGDPDDPAQWEFIRGFSPYHLAAPDRSYPPVLLTSSTRDDRVHPGHGRKMTARLAEYGHSVRYYENIEGGHGGAADNEQAAFMSALAYTFLWQHLGAAPS